MKVPRVAEIVLGAWLFVSAFLWTHYLPHMVNTWVVAVAIMTFSLVAIRVDWVRHLNAVVAAWLLMYTLISGTAEVATVWNNAIVALAVLSLSFVGQPRQQLTHRSAQASA